jgi:hypothetical protein
MADFPSLCHDAIASAQRRAGASEGLARKLANFHEPSSSLISFQDFVLRVSISSYPRRDQVKRPALAGFRP